MCDLTCAEAGGIRRYDGWSTSVVAASDLVCAVTGGTGRREDWSATVLRHVTCFLQRLALLDGVAVETQVV